MGICWEFTGEGNVTDCRRQCGDRHGFTWHVTSWWDSQWMIFSQKKWGVTSGYSSIMGYPWFPNWDYCCYNQWKPNDNPPAGKPCVLTIFAQHPRGLGVFFAESGAIFTWRVLDNFANEKKSSRLDKICSALAKLMSLDINTSSASQGFHRYSID